MKLIESIQDIRSWLLNDIVSEVDRLGSNDSQEIAVFVVGRSTEDFPEDSVIPEVERVIVYKVLGSEVEPVDTDHYVVKFNGEYFDFTATQYNEEFSNLIKDKDLPVVQKVLTSDRQLSQGVSTIKSYALLRYDDV